MFGRGGDHIDYLYVYIGSFIGGGLVLDGHLFPGRTSNGGALGSMPAYAGGDRSGRAPQLMNVASIYVLERKLDRRGAQCRHPVAIARRLGQRPRSRPRRMDRRSRRKPRLRHRRGHRGDRRRDRDHRWRFPRACPDKHRRPDARSRGPGQPPGTVAVPADRRHDRQCGARHGRGMLSRYSPTSPRIAKSCSRKTARFPQNLPIR